MSPDVERIWNRARLDGGGPLRAGDRALADLLRFHALATEQTVQHAIASLGPEDFEAVLQAFSFFGFGAVRDLLEHARSRSGSKHEEASGDDSVQLDYAGLIPDDSVLHDAVQAHWRAQPSAFAPVIEA